MKTILTDRAVTKLVAPERGRLEVLDSKMPGLALRITPSGHKTLNLTVTGFRLRSIAVVTWAGSVSGRDHLFVDAALLDGNGQTVWNEAVSASSMRGSVIFGSESGRLENLARTAAGGLARDLRQR